MVLSGIGAVVALLLSTAAGQYTYPNNGTGGNGGGPDADGKYTIQAEGIKAQFIPYGASITNMFIKDKNGVERDIILGFDNATAYETSGWHPHLGGVPGRYANRIKNSTFTIDGQTYHVLPNENNGADTLHGGPNGWDWRNFTVVSHTESSITFSILDPDGSQGFPGEVVSYITYTMTPYTWHMKMVALATDKLTPIMLSSHDYWNLDGLQNPETDTIFNHTLYMPYSGQRVGTDSILIPNGTILPNQPGSVNDFWSAPKQFGVGINDPAIDGNCGAGCNGYDTCYLVNRAQNGPYDWHQGDPVLSMWSDFSGIKLDIWTDQDALQIYSCNTMNGTFPVKSTQGTKSTRTVPIYGCVVIEVEDWIDAINQPEWQRDKKNIFGPETGPYVLEATYVFSIEGNSVTQQQGVTCQGGWTKDAPMS